MLKPVFMVLVAALIAGRANACECAMEVPATFCGTLGVSWNTPHATVLGVKLDEVYYGMRVKVLATFSGDAVVGDTITVWGDNGGLCRWSVDTWNDGDTVLWGFHETDFIGNVITAGYPPNLERTGDYHISVCGINWLAYNNGTVTGPIAPGVDATPISAFSAELMQCLLSNAVPETQEQDHLRIRYTPDGPWIASTMVGLVELTMFDPQGRAVIQRSWDGSALLLAGVSTGAYLVEVRRGSDRLVRKVVLQ